MPGHLPLTCEQTWSTDFQLKFEFIFHWVSHLCVQESGQTQPVIGVLGLGAEAVWVFARKGIEEKKEGEGGGGRGRGGKKRREEEEEGGRGNLDSQASMRRLQLSNWSASSQARASAISFTQGGPQYRKKL